jgi:hypothetical protein
MCFNVSNHNLKWYACFEMYVQNGIGCIACCFKIVNVMIIICLNGILVSFDV